MHVVKQSQLSFAASYAGTSLLCCLMYIEYRGKEVAKQSQSGVVQDYAMTSLPAEDEKS